MASPYQRASFRRKLTYFGMIVALFVVTLFARGVVALPLSGLAEDVDKWTIQGQAKRLDLSELEQTEGDLTGSTIRLLLTGSRGLAICILWESARENQLRHEWSKLEHRVQQITKLQPHFTTPWLFQSWNLTYNVSVELDRLNDMYFYIGRGIKLLADGERRNKNNPDMRYNIGTYYQTKFGVSDKVDTLRCLFQLSCIPLEDRDPDRLLNADRKTVNLQKFEEFCRANPQLVRRLRESKVAAHTPEDVVRFLRDNQKVPGRYVERTRELADRLKQFPVLPPWNNERELSPNTTMTDATADGYLAARAWFRHSLDAVPPPDGVPSAAPTDYDRTRYRVPRAPMLIIFRQGAPRAQAYVAERLQKEGWFDTSPWVVDEGISSSDRWFPGEVALAPSDHSKRAWEETHAEFKEHGRLNGLDLSEEQKQAYYSRARLYASLKGIGVDEYTPEPRPDELANPEVRDSYLAHRAMMYFRQNLQVTQFDKFLYRAEAEMEDRTVQARELIARADRFRQLAQPTEAIEAYEQAFVVWKEIFLRRPNFRALDSVQEDLYEKYLQYEGLARQERDGDARQRAVLALHDLMGYAGGATGGLPLRAATNPGVLRPMVPALQTVEPLAIPGPLDGADPDGRPWVSADVKERVKMRLGIIKPAPPPETITPDGALPPPGKS